MRRRRFFKAFAALPAVPVLMPQQQQQQPAATQADAIIRPLLTPVPWVHDVPRDPNVHFIVEAHRDIRTATQNSREWAEAGATSGRRGGGFGGVGAYINPIDPIYKG